MTPLPPLVDKHGRVLESLRLSVTDVCNFRCLYCMPDEDMQWLDSESLLTFDEMERLARLFLRLGVKSIRLTGGEPTLRPRLPELVRRLAALRCEGLEELSLTTNGMRLKTLARPLAEAGLDRLNVSLDSLDPRRFEQITRRPALGKVLEGLAVLEQIPELHPIKVNAVAIRGITEPEVLEFAALARRKPYIIRFIEYMPLDNQGNWAPEWVLTGDEIRRRIHAVWPLAPVAPTRPSETARRWRFADGSGEIGFINPVSEPFCADCDRIRLTPDGHLMTCLFATEETDLRTALRTGASDEELAGLVRGACYEKELKHKINEGKAFESPRRSMSRIGG